MGPSFSAPEVAALVKRPRLALTVVRDPDTGALGVAPPGVPPGRFTVETTLPAASPASQLSTLLLPAHLRSATS